MAKVIDMRTLGHCSRSPAHPLSCIFNTSQYNIPHFIFTIISTVLNHREWG